MSSRHDKTYILQPSITGLNSTNMPSAKSSIEIAHPIPIQISVQDVIEKIKARRNIDTLIHLTRKLYAQTSPIWNPRAIYCWLPVHQVDKENVVLGDDEDCTKTSLNMGFSAHFMQPAKMAFLGVYTAGPELEILGKKATTEQRYLDAYIIELISLTVLDKARDAINTHIEQKAAENDWKVGPFLSPGSVHGWELNEQLVINSLLPLSKIDIECSDIGVLSPFNSVSCVIGIGPGYDETRVGSTCKVCSNRDTCNLRTE